MSLLLPLALCAALAGALLAWCVRARLSGRESALGLALGFAPGAGRLLEQIHEHSPIGLVLCGEDGRFLRANAAFLRISGHTEESLRTHAYEEAAADEWRKEQAAQARELLRAHGAFPPYETELLNRDGVAVPVRVAGVRARGALTWRIVEDLSMRRQMAEALRHSESEARMLSAVASHSQSMVVICDAQGHIEWVNQAFETVTGYSQMHARGKRPSELLEGPETDPAVSQRIRAGFAAHESFFTELVNYTRDGRIFWVALECTPVFDHAGALERYVTVGRDITEERATHQALTQSEERFRDLTDLSSDFFWEQDAQFRFVQMTETGKGGGGAQLRLGQAPWENPFSLLGPEAWARHRAVLAERKPFSDFENPVLSSEGYVVWRLISGKPLFDAEGNFTGYRGVGRDISARKEAEEYIQESKRMYRRVVEGVRDIIFQTDGPGNFVFLNRAWTEATGYGVEEVIGEPLCDYMHPEDREGARRMMGAATAKVGEFTESVGRIRCKNGEYRWFEARMQSYTEADGEFITVGTLHDVTGERAAIEDRRNARAALRAAQERHQRALDAANDGMWERDLRNDRVFYSMRFKELLGFTEDEFPNDRTFLYERIHSEDYPGFEASLAQMLTQRTRSVIECRIRCRDGGYRWFRLRSTVTCDAEGALLFTSGTLTDIHVARQAEDELRRHRDDLAGMVAERTASAVSARIEAEAAREAAETANRSKTEFLANMSHELRTPMHAILSFAGFGVDKARAADRDKLLHYFTSIHRSGGRLLGLLNDLLDLSKLEAGKMEMHLQPADAGQLLRDARAEAEALARSRGIRIELKFPPRPARAMLDAKRTQQVLANLLSNAVKFSPRGGTVLLSLSHARMPAGEGSGEIAAVQIAVGDEGIGIPEDELETVFDKFVQSSKTKTGAGGTGLGLAICREIVSGHGGTIEARNNPPPAHGACFVVRLPVGELPAGEEEIPDSMHDSLQIEAHNPHIFLSGADILGEKG